MSVEIDTDDDKDIRTDVRTAVPYTSERLIRPTSIEVRSPVAPDMKDSFIVFFRDMKDFYRNCWSRETTRVCSHWRHGRHNHDSPQEINDFYHHPEISSPKA